MMTTVPLDIEKCMRHVKKRAKSTLHLFWSFNLYRSASLHHDKFRRMVFGNERVQNIDGHSCFGRVEIRPLSRYAYYKQYGGTATCFGYLQECRISDVDPRCERVSTFFTIFTYVKSWHDSRSAVCLM